MAGLGSDIKEHLSFPITFAKLWYGSGPFRSYCRPSADDEPDPNEDQPKMFLELKAEHDELRRHLGRQSAIASIYSDPTGTVTNSEGVVFRGTMCIGELEEYGVSQGFVEIDGLLTPQTYDAVASMLITNGTALLSRCTLHISLKEESSKIDFNKREGPLKTADFFLEDLAITVEIGEQHDDLSDE